MEQKDAHLRPGRASKGARRVDRRDTEGTTSTVTAAPRKKGLRQTHPDVSWRGF